VQLASGSIEVNGTAMSAGDGVALTDETIVEITASEESEFLLFDLG
jgi:redox-sensitive bicupin YhaK (pirin superfamily)